MKEIVVAALVAFSLGAAFAANAEAPAKAKMALQPAKAPLAPTPTGPSGFGAIKIGMTQDSLTNLKAADGVYLVGPFVAHASGEQNLGPTSSGYTAMIATPFDHEPREASFVFVAGILTEFSIKLDDATFAQAKSQLEDKYGPGKPDNDQHEEQCVYRNGAAFKVAWGTIAVKWDQQISSTERIRSSASELTVNTCPPRLDIPSMGPMTWNYISIRMIKTDPSKPNLF